jgi:hypothetical protein
MNVTFIKADQSNKEWKWMVVCNDHSNVTTADTKKELLNLKTIDFCDCCTGDCSSFCNECDGVA